MITDSTRKAAAKTATNRPYIRSLLCASCHAASPDLRWDSTIRTLAALRQS